MLLPVVKQINTLLWYLHRRQEQHWLQHKVGWWEHKRTAGRARFVWRYALGWGLTMTLVHRSWDYFNKDSFSIGFGLFTMLLFLGFGWFVAASAWTDNERLYERAKQGDGSADAQSRVE
jgi:hypothetical protein